MTEKAQIGIDMTQPQAVSEPTNQNDGNLPEIDKVLESSDNWLEYEPKTELGKVFYKWSQSNLPRHMPIEDWNRPWAVAHTQAFEQLLSQALTNARREATGTALRVLDTAEVERWFDMPNTTDNWRTWKRIRNTIVDLNQEAQSSPNP